MIHRMLVTSLLLASCGSDASVRLAAAPREEPSSAALVAACDLAQVRCSRCHTTGRIVQMQVARPADWQGYVHRMRLMPGSGIPPAEERPIARCLVFRTFGSKGLSQLEETP